MSLDVLGRWLFDPTLGKITAAVVAVVVIRTVAGLLSKGVLGRIKDTTQRVHLVEAPPIDVRVEDRRAPGVPAGTPSA